tara:strand:+ start:40 stop:417 length:378 start_codon:yes stop_codon:yes gene_type:complete
MPKTCNSDECNNPRFSNGFCRNHQNERTDDKWMNKSRIAIRKSIKPISDKKSKELAIYRVNRDKFMDENPICQYGNCKREVNDLHHKAGRGIELTNVKNFMSVCREHHTYIHLHPKESRSLGYLI